MIITFLSGLADYSTLFHSLFLFPTTTTLPTTMPGPKMGARPPDFDEEVIKQSPTYIKWTSLPNGTKLRYACRDFVKGNGDDEERLMRRIMIARRNNLKDHDKLKKARIITSTPANKKRRVGNSTNLSDAQVAKEMDIAAVEGTRSFKTWIELPEGAEFVYNQKYIKGKERHDWLLRKNIWRRMRYRRDNKKLVSSVNKGDSEEMAAENIVDHVLEVKPPEFNQDVVDAAVAAAEQYVKTEVHNPFEATATNAALDAAAKLAAGDLDHETSIATTMV